jgi:hypothetical protein
MATGDGKWVLPFAADELKKKKKDSNLDSEKK